jgi:hypothetical protein
MPLGNEAFQVAVRSDLKGQPLTPSVVLGVVRGEFYSAGNKKTGNLETQVRGTHASGVLESLLWGKSNPQAKFRRVSMKGGGADDVGGGFLYLFGQIQPKPAQRFWIAVTAFILSMIAWVVAAVAGERAGWRSDSSRFRY